MNNNLKHTTRTIKIYKNITAMKKGKESFITAIYRPITQECQIRTTTSYKVRRIEIEIK